MNELTKTNRLSFKGSLGEKAVPQHNLKEIHGEGGKSREEDSASTNDNIFALFWGEISIA